MHVAVTGASGHVGSALVRELSARGHRVRAIARTDVRSLEGLDVEVRRLDVTDAAAVKDALGGMEVVFHAAAQLSLASGPDPVAEATNVEGTRNVIAACRAVGARRLVHFSSAHALKKDGAELLGAEEGLVYERSKAVAERLVLEAAARDVDAVVVSPCAVVGPWDFKPSYLGRFLIMLSGGFMLATVRGGQSWVDVRDVARSAAEAAERGVRGERYVLGGHWLPMHDFATLASQAVGVRAPLVALPTGVGKAFAPLATLAARFSGREPIFTSASMDALETVARPFDPNAERVLGHAPRPLETTLADTFDFFVARGLCRRKAR